MISVPKGTSAFLDKKYFVYVVKAKHPSKDLIDIKLSI